eukprot:NODE_207_length_14754_cov_0.677994.p3 type:complete len:428 gc:universal NODE_207_length_14754_cov_0.677994:3445-4728(+)
MSTFLYPTLDKSYSVPVKKVKVHSSGAIACLSNTLVVLKQPKPISYQKPCKSIAWHPTQLKIYAGNENGEVELWSPTHLKEAVNHFKPHLSTILALDVSMNYDVASGSSDKTIKIYNSEMRYVTTLNAHSNWVRELQWRDPFTLISASDDHTIKIWDIRSKSQQTIQYKGNVTDMQVHSVDQVVGITHSSFASIFDFRQLEIIQLYPLAYQPRGLSFSGSSMVVAGPYSFEVFNVQSGELKYHCDVEEQIFDVEWMNHKAYFATTKSLQVWDIPSLDSMNTGAAINENATIENKSVIYAETQKDLKSEIRKFKTQKISRPKNIAKLEERPLAKETTSNGMPSLPKSKKREQKGTSSSKSKFAGEVTEAGTKSVASPVNQEKTAETFLLERSVEVLTTQVEMLTRTVDVLLDRLEKVEHLVAGEEEVY